MNILMKMCQLPCQNLHGLFKRYLINLYDKDNVYSDPKNFIYAKGEIPLLLVAHMDTVFSEKNMKKEFFYDSQKSVLWSPQGAGFDDRAGCYAIYTILNSLCDRGAPLPDVLLTTGEERGAIGAKAFSSIVLSEEIFIEPWKYMIELDRQGEDECVFYHCKNNTFKQFISKYGFTENLSYSYSDVSFIAPVVEVAPVNLSIGYVDEHSYCERLHYDWMFRTIEKVLKMIKDIPNTPYFSFF